MDHPTRLKRLRFRAWHRGTKEADLLIGGFFDTHGSAMAPAELDRFEQLLDEEDVDIMGWAIGSIPVPAHWQGALIERLQRLDYIPVAR